MTLDELAVWSIIGVTIVTVVPYALRHRKREHRAVEAEERARQQGLHEPATLHPMVHAGTCIGIGNCISVCPEGEVIALRDGQAHPIAPAKCIGHGLCERVCPVEAIQLVFGTETRGVDIPRIKQNFETNVPGIYVIGELGGMGLIRNAFEQGRQCISGILKEGSRGPADALDVLIVGSGPAGLSASLNCLHRRLKFRTIEREDIGGTVRHYPRKKLVMTAPVKIPGYGRLNVRELLKEELIEIWEDVVAKTGLEINTNETVATVTSTADRAFTVSTDKGTYKAKRVVLAIGRRGVPRKLQVSGEDLPKVVYSLKEPEAFRDDQIMVVGGGDSAVEAALALAAQPGNSVTMSYRRDRFSRIKPRNRDRIEKAIAHRSVDVLWSTNVVEIKPKAVAYRDESDQLRSMPNSMVFIFAGGELPTKFLQSCGIQVDTKFGQPLG